MFRILLLFSIFLNVDLLAKGEIQKISDDPLFIKGSAKNCKEINSFAESFNQLRLLTNDEIIMDRPTCECRDGNCEADLTKYIPEHMKDLVDTYSEHEGPNCINAVQYALKVSNTLSYQDAFSTMDWLSNRDKCIEIKRDEELKVGDVVSVYYREFPTHVFLYLGEGLTFSKDGPKANQSYRFSNMSDELNVVNSKAMSGDCFMVTDEEMQKDNDLMNKCFFDRVVAYRCEHDPIGSKIHKGIINLECSLEKIKNENLTNPAQLKFILPVLNALFNDLKEKVDQNDLVQFEFRLRKLESSIRKLQK